LNQSACSGDGAGYRLPLSDQTSNAFAEVTDNEPPTIGYSGEEADPEGYSNPPAHHTNLRYAAHLKGLVQPIDPM
jgi:hypothetical protein